MSWFGDVKKEDRKISTAEMMKEATKKARKNMKNVFLFCFEDILIISLDKVINILTFSISEKRLQMPAVFVLL